MKSHWIEASLFALNFVTTQEWQLFLCLYGSKAEVMQTLLPHLLIITSQQFFGHEATQSAFCTQSLKIFRLSIRCSSAHSSISIHLCKETPICASFTFMSGFCDTVCISTFKTGRKTTYISPKWLLERSLVSVIVIALSLVKCTVIGWKWFPALSVARKWTVFSALWLACLGHFLTTLLAAKLKINGRGQEIFNIRGFGHVVLIE